MFNISFLYLRQYLHKEDISLRNLKNLSLILLVVLSISLILSGCGDDGSTVFTAPDGDTGATGATGVTGPADLATLEVRVELPANVPSEDVVVAIARSADEIITSSKVIEASGFTYIFTELLPGTYTGTVTYKNDLISTLRNITVIGGETNYYPEEGSMNVGNAYIIYSPYTADKSKLAEYHLGKLNLLIGDVTDIGTFEEEVKFIALSPDRVLYGIRAEDTSTKGGIDSQLITINPTTLDVTDVGSPMGLGFSSISGLNFDTSGNLWLSTETSEEIYQIDKVTGQGTLIGTSGAQHEDIAAFDELYGVGSVSDSKNGYHKIYKISTSDASISNAKDIELAYNDKMDFDSTGTLWALSASYTSGKKFSTDGYTYVVNPETGDMTYLGHASNIDFYDMAVLH